MTEDRAVRTTVRTTDSGTATRSENKGLDQALVMDPISVPEPVAPAPSSSSSTGDGAQTSGGGTPPIDFDG
jgi:hypothetical protein